MPLTPKYSWSETEAAIEVTVDVPGVSRSNADVFATDAFLKVNCPPYLFALDLYKEVEDHRSSATIVPHGVVFKLVKREPGLWVCLAAQGDKAALTARRNASIDRAYAALEEARKARLARRQQEDKHATQRSIDVDRRKRQEVDRAKAEELAEERGRLEEWRTGLEEGGRKDADAESDYEDEEVERQAGAAEEAGAAGAREQQGEEAAAAPDHPDYYGRGWRPPKFTTSTKAAAAAAAAAPKAPHHHRDASSDEDRSDRDEEGDEGDEEWAERRGGHVVSSSASSAPGESRLVTFKPLPPPRTKLTPVQVTFTKLETGYLPAREQREEEIRAIRKQVRSAAPSGDDPDSLGLAERQPMFLKDKGDAMFRAGDYNGALNAYTRAISLDDSLPALRSNRAACRLALGDCTGAVEDCDRALEMLGEVRDRLECGDMGSSESAAAISKQLVRLLVRRAQARVALAGAGAGGGGGANRGPGTGGSEHLTAALADYDAALRLSPSDPVLVADRSELVAALQPADAAALRQRGDARFRSGDYEGAVEAFSALVGLPRTKVPESERLAGFSNRAACQLVLERFTAALADCDAGLALLLPHHQHPSAAPVESTAGTGSASAAHGDVGVGGGGGQEFGAAAGEQGLARLAAWAQTLVLPGDGDGSGGEGSGGGGCGLAPAAAAAAAARLLTRRGAAAAHLQRFAAAAADHAAAAALLVRLGEGAKAAAAEADAARMGALAEGREQLPPSPPPPQAPPQPPAPTLPPPSTLPSAPPQPQWGAWSREGAGAY